MYEQNEFTLDDLQAVLHELVAEGLIVRVISDDDERYWPTGAGSAANDGAEN